MRVFRRAPRGASRRVRAAAAVAALLAAAAALAGCSGGGTGATGGGTGGDQKFVAGDGSLVLLPAAERAAAPALTGTTLDGGTFALADQRGKVVVLNVWASWCAPCQAEAPSLSHLARSLAASPVQFVGLNTRDSAAAAKAFVATFELDYPQVVDTDGSLQLAFRDSLPPQAIPSTIVVDAHGRVAARALGKVSESSLRGLVEPLLREAASAGASSGASQGASP